MRTTVLNSTLAAVALVIGSSLPAAAGQVSFDFNTSLAVSDANATIATYLHNILLGQGVNSAVTVGGGAVVDQTWNGDGHVVGPVASQPKTLGTSEGTSAPAGTVVCAANNTCSAGPLDNYIKTSGSVKDASGNDFFSFSFTNLTITSVSFDYEIFPDGSCPSAPCASLPDFKFGAGPAPTSVFTIFGSTPSGANIHSPASTVSNNELAPQAIGVTSGIPVASLAFGETVIGVQHFVTMPGGGVTSLTFTDWPATIGIDNLTINYTTSAVPEPGSMLLLGTGLVGLYVRRKKRQAA